MRRLTKAERETREQVYERDGRCTLAHLPHAGPCGGYPTPHHRRKAGQGGAYTLTNLVAACSVHNDRLEENADMAKAARVEGLVVRRGDPDWDLCGVAPPT